MLSLRLRLRSTRAVAATSRIRYRVFGLAACAAAAACAAEAPQSEELGAQTQTLLAAAGSPAPAPRDFFEYWLALHRRHHHRPDWARCGNGRLEAGEACDDGNLEPHDGCDSQCELDNDAATPGDDRPGYVLCATSDDPNLTCGPEQRCCRSPENVCDSLERDCQREGVTVGWGDNCDGPEDCEDGLTCVRSKYGASCVPANPQQGYPVLCHTHQDCRFLPESGCGVDGVCTKL